MDSVLDQNNVNVVGSVGCWTVPVQNAFPNVIEPASMAFVRGKNFLTMKP